jgi:hypothetical protein
MKRILIITVGFAIFVSSCRKNDDAKSVTLANRIKTVTETGNGISGAQVSTYFYDNEGRQIKATRHDGTVSEITYQAGKVIFKRTNAQSQVSQSTGYLNEAGFLVSTQSATSSVTYAYNTDGYLVNDVQISYSNNQANPFQISNHYYNPTSGVLDSTVFNVSGVKSVRYYTQYTSHVNNAFERFGTPFNPPSLKFLYKEMKSRGANNIVFTTITDYEFDTKGRLIKETFTTGATVKTNMYEYYE